MTREIGTGTELVGYRDSLKKIIDDFYGRVVGGQKDGSSLPSTVPEEDIKMIVSAARQALKQGNEPDKFLRELDGLVEKSEILSQVDPHLLPKNVTPRLIVDGLQNDIRDRLLIAFMQNYQDRSK